MATKFKKYSEIEGIRDLLIIIILLLLMYHFKLWNDVQNIFNEIISLLNL